MNPLEEARNRRQRAAHVRQVARNISDRQAINNLKAFADDLEREAAEFEAQAAAVVDAVKVTETSAQQTDAVPALKPVGDNKQADDPASEETTKPSDQRS